MTQRVKMIEAIPNGYKAVSALQQHVNSAIDDDLLALVQLRASTLNGCAFCVDMHSTAARKNGEDVRRLLAVSVWRESPFFTPEERAALALTDAVTRLGEGGIPDDVWDGAVAAYGPSKTMELVLAIATINVWNRLVVANRSTPLPL